MVIVEAGERERDCKRGEMVVVGEMRGEMVMVGRERQFGHGGGG